MSKPTREYIYGMNPAFEVLRAGKRKIYEAYLDETRIEQPRFNELIQLLGEKDIPMDCYAIVIWSESENTPWICIEPWMGPPNSAGRGAGLQLVPPGESSRFAVEVSLL